WPAVNCGQAGGTCFCVSMQTGPKADSGFDLALTELIDDSRHEFLVEAGSESGADLLYALPQRPATDADISAAAAAVARAESQMGSTLDTDGLKELLQDNLNHPRWDQVAERCLSCANCTMVCPTCFCATVEDHTDLTGTSADRVRVWDSCFTIRPPDLWAMSRTLYRHQFVDQPKISAWKQRFGGVEVIAEMPKRMVGGSVGERVEADG